MKIEINQKKFNFFQDQYEINIDGKLKFLAKSKILAFYPKIGIYRLDKRQVLSVEKKSRNIIDLNYSLKYDENGFVDIHTDSLISYSIKNSKGTFHFYEQENNVIGIFLNAKQIGLIDKNEKVYFGADKYLILLENEIIDEILIIGFVLAYDNQKNNDKSALDFDWGNVMIKPVVEVDPNWTPEKEKRFTTKPKRNADFRA